MFGFGKKADGKEPRKKRKSKKQIKKEGQERHAQNIRKGLLFWVPGGSSRLDVYLDYCVMRCMGKTKMEEKERVIPFNSILDVTYTPARGMRNGNIQLITKEMPNVKQSYWYPYENNMVVLQPTTEDLAKKAREYILRPNGNSVPSEYLMQIKKEIREAELKEKLEKEQEELAKKEADKAARAAAREEKEAAQKAVAETEQEEASETE